MPPGPEQSCIHAMKIYEFDSKTLPSTTVETPDPVLIAEEKRLVHRLRVLKRRTDDANTGLFRDWEGPRNDRLVLL